MTITSIVPVDKRKCKVFVDEGFAFVLYKGEIGRLGLAEGATLSEELYRQIETELLNRRARERSVDLLKASDKSESQIRSRLEEDGFPQPVIDRTIALLKKHRYVDDEAFARREWRHAQEPPSAGLRAASKGRGQRAGGRGSAGGGSARGGDSPPSCAKKGGQSGRPFAGGIAEIVRISGP